jgi:GNAT superfamily N-acetyltransferase
VGSSAFVVRSATRDDAPLIADVHIRTWREAYAGQLPDGLLASLPLTFERRKQHWKQLAESRHERDAVLVAERDGEVVGFVHACASRDPDSGPATGEVTAIYVRRSQWGRGIGKALLEGATDRLRDSGFADATLWVLETNAATRRFYESQGWQLEGSKKVDWQGDVGLREVRYRVDLSGSAAQKSS